MTKITKGNGEIKLSLEFVRIFTPSGVQGFRLFFHLKFSSLEGQRNKCVIHLGTVCRLGGIREGKVRVTQCNFPCSVFSVLSLPNLPEETQTVARVTGPGITPLHYWNCFGVCPKTGSPLTSLNNLNLISLFIL